MAVLVQRAEAFCFYLEVLSHLFLSFFFAVVGLVLGAAPLKPKEGLNGPPSSSCFFGSNLIADLDVKTWQNVA